MNMKKVTKKEWERYWYVFHLAWDHMALDEILSNMRYFASHGCFRSHE